MVVASQQLEEGDVPRGVIVQDIHAHRAALRRRLTVVVLFVSENAIVDQRVFDIRLLRPKVAEASTILICVVINIRRLVRVLASILRRSALSSRDGARRECAITYLGGVRLRFI